MHRFLLLILLLILSTGIKSMAQGDLLVTPTRVVFDNKKQKEALNLANMGNDSASFSISFVEYNMKEDGSFVIIEKPDSGQMLATPYLRVFPRRVTLTPGESQVVMLHCKRNSEMLPGEYRSHLYFRVEKKDKPLDTRILDTALLKVQLIPVYGLSIPVIIRLGSAKVSSTLSNLKLVQQPNGNQYIAFTINRMGNFSLYGDITVTFISNLGTYQEVSKVKGVGVYTNINKRNMLLKLNNQSKRPLTGGTLKINYVASGQAKKYVYAEGELVIP